MEAAKASHDDTDPQRQPRRDQSAKSAATGDGREEARVRRVVCADHFTLLRVNNEPLRRRSHAEGVKDSRDTPPCPPPIVPSSRYQAHNSGATPGVTAFQTDARCNAKKTGPSGSPCCSPSAESIRWPPKESHDGAAYAARVYRRAAGRRGTRRRPTCLSGSSC